MSADAHHLRVVRDRHQHLTTRLRQVLGETSTDDQGEEIHGLAWWYPQVKQWPAVRSVGASGAGGRGGSSAAPINLEALAFVTGRYWIGEDNLDAADDQALEDPANYRQGFEPTVLELERTIRRALGHMPPPSQPRGADPLWPAPTVTAALAYLSEFAPEIAADQYRLELVREEAIRLIAWARGMMHGSLWTTGSGPCPECHGPNTVVNDGDRAVCLNPFCRDPDGGRTCWGFDRDRKVWVRINEPDRPGRGRLDDRQLSKLTGADLIAGTA